jgi:AI-2 transport protein TqsA
MNIIKWASVLIIIFLTFTFLKSSSPYLIPIVLASVFSFLIIEISGTFRSIKIKDKKIPNWLSMCFSIGTVILILWLLIIIINGNIQKVIVVAPIYQEKLITLSEPILSNQLILQFPEINEAINSINITKVLSMVAGIAKDITSNAAMILIYSVFILLEYRIFKYKLSLIFKKIKINDIIDDINKDIRIYVLIKSGLSLLTAILSFIVLHLAGIDFAPLWAMLIFLLNFIPTVGSIIAVSFPIIISLVQFDGLFIFTVVAISLVSIQVMIGNFLEPRLMGKSLNLSPLVILLSLVLWGNIWGITGMLLCVPITVIANIILAKFESTKPIAIMLSANGKIDK